MRAIQEEVRASKTLRNLLDYIIDHYTAIKEVHLYDTKLLTFQAKSTGKQLTALWFSCCEIGSDALLQLSLSVECIDLLTFDRCIARSSNSSDRKFRINMPQTTIGKLTISYNNENEDAVWAPLAKFVTGIPTQTTEYLIFEKRKVAKIDEMAYNKLSVHDRNDEIIYNAISANCRSLDMICVTSYPDGLQPYFV